MIQYIDKDTVVAAIKKRYKFLERKKEFNSHNIEYEIRMSECQHLMLILNTIKTKEVDLEKEISDYLTSYHLHIKDGGRVVFDNNDSPNFMCDIRHIAKHFYELGLNKAEHKV